jgi:hypothetical protein
MGTSPMCYFEESENKGVFFQDEVYDKKVRVERNIELFLFYSSQFFSHVSPLNDVFPLRMQYED